MLLKKVRIYVFLISHLFFLIFSFQLAAAESPIPDTTDDRFGPPQHFVFVHGAWHGAWCWYKMINHLKNAGHTAHAIELPGHGVDMTAPADIELEDYKLKVVDYLDSVAEPVILVGHSMGGIVISLAAEARPAKIKKLVYVAAFLPENGQNLLQLAQMDTQSLVMPNMEVFPDLFVAGIDRSALQNMFYSSCNAPVIQLASLLIRSEPIKPLDTPVILTAANFGSVRRFYVKTTHDQAVTLTMQNLMLTNQPCERVYQIHSGHSPFFSRPDRLKMILLEISGL